MFSIICRLPVFYILSSLLIFLIGLLLFIVINQWYPESNRHLELQSKISYIREEIIHIIKLNEFSKNYSTLQQDLKIYKTRLETPLSQSDLTEKLYKIASRNRVRVLSEANKTKEINALKITIKSLLVEGKYASIRKYFYDLNRLKSMVYINRIEIKSKKKSHKVKASIQLVVYSAIK